MATTRRKRYSTEGGGISDNAELETSSGSDLVYGPTLPEDFYEAADQEEPAAEVAVSAPEPVEEAPKIEEPAEVKKRVKQKVVKLPKPAQTVRSRNLPKFS